MTDTLTCPVCTNAVPGTSSMCLSCHLPIKDVRANQPRFSGALAASALAGPWTLAFVVPGAVVGLYFHLFKGRPWRAVLSATFIAGAIVLGAQLVGRPFHEVDPPAGESQSEKEVSYDELKVLRVDDRFDGTIELTNHTNVHANMYVTVHIYNDDQDIGELHGDISLKPHSTARVDLQSFDDYSPFNSTVVELLGLPAAVD